MSEGKGDPMTTEETAALNRLRVLAESDPMIHAVLNAIGNGGRVIETLTSALIVMSNDRRELTRLYLDARSRRAPDARP